jgi:hypothetical protein
MGKDKDSDKPKLRVITEAEFEELEAKYKHLYVVDVAFDDKERYQFIVRRPTRNVIEAVGANKGDVFKVADLMITNMVVAGDTDALDDGVVYSRLLECLTGIVQEGKKLFTKA